jgi:hypothetical protein
MTNLGSVSAYFWWVAFLRASPDYWWICQEKGDCSDPRLVQVWRDFGDLYRYETFSDWWQSRGETLFAPAQSSLLELAPLPLPTGLALMTEGEVRRIAQDLLYVSVDTKQASSHRAEVLGQALAALIRHRKDEQRLLRYPLLPIDAKSRRKLVPSYQALALEAYVSSRRSDDPAHRWGCFEMGERIGLAPTVAPGKVLTLAQTKKRQNTTRSLFCQAKKAALAVIANVEIGRFPSRKPVTQIERWTPTQRRRRDASGWHERWGLNQWVAKEQRFLLGAGSVVQRVPQFLIGLAALPLALSGDWQTAASVATCATQG